VAGGVETGAALKPIEIIKAKAEMSAGKRKRYGNFIDGLEWKNEWQGYLSGYCTVW
jgi:hypothetical protein